MKTQLTITNEYYVYQHRRLDTNQVFYVGKGKEDRAYDKNKLVL